MHTLKGFGLCNGTYLIRSQLLRFPGFYVQKRQSRRFLIVTLVLIFFMVHLLLPVLTVVVMDGHNEIVGKDIAKLRTGQKLERSVRKWEGLHGVARGTMRRRWTGTKRAHRVKKNTSDHVGGRSGTAEFSTMGLCVRARRTQAWHASERATIG